jgi:hypothetical protein
MMCEIIVVLPLCSSVLASRLLSVLAAYRRGRFISAVVMVLDGSFGLK